MAILRGSKYPIIGYLRFLGVAIVVQVWGKYMIIRYVDPSGYTQKTIIRAYEVSHVARTHARIESGLVARLSD